MNPFTLASLLSVSLAAIKCVQPGLALRAAATVITSGNLDSVITPYPDLEEWSAVHDDFGNVLSVDNPDLDTTGLLYDEWERLVNITPP